MTIEALAREELTLSFEERQEIVDNASDAWLNGLPLDDNAIETAILDFQARMLPELYPDYSHNAKEVTVGLQLEQRFFVLRGIASALQLDEYRATAVAQRMGVHFSMMFTARKQEQHSEDQLPLFNYWPNTDEPDALAV